MHPTSARRALVLGLFVLTAFVAWRRPAPPPDAPATPPAAPLTAEEAPAPATVFLDGPRVAGPVGLAADWNRPLPANLATRLLSLHDGGRVREKDGTVHYNGLRYHASIEATRAEWALPPLREGRFRPRWSYALETVEVDGLPLLAPQRGLPRTGADGASVSLQHGAVEEKYLFLDEGLEQLFVIPELPRRGDLRIAGRVAGNLEPPPDGTRGPQLAFRHRGEETVRVSEAVAIDAAGERLALDLSFEDGRLALHVPGDWVARAQLPITIDPLIGSPLVIDPNPIFGMEVQAAFNSTTQTWLVVWSEVLGTQDDRNIHGRTVDGAGVLGPVLNLATLTTLHEAGPRIAYAPNLNRFCLAYGARTPMTEAYTRLVYARMLNADGTPVAGSSPILVHSRPSSITDGYGGIGLAYDGTRWLALWRYSGQVTSGGVTTYWSELEGRFLSSAGALSTVISNLDGAALQPNIPHLVFNAGSYAVLWPEYDGVSTTTLMARTVSTSGTLGSRTSLGTDIYPGVVAAGGGRLLLAWMTNQAPVVFQTGIVGRLYSSSFAPVTGPFVVAEGVDGIAAESASFSTVSNCWMLTVKSRWGMYDTPPVELRAHRVDFDGKPYPGVLIASRPNQTNGSSIAAHSTAATMLCVFAETGSSTAPLTAQRLTTDAPPPPPAPTGLAAVPGDSQVRLTWNAVAGATAYNLLRGENGGPLSYIGSVTTTSFTDLTLINGTAYGYALSVNTPEGESGFTAIVSATPAAPGSIPALFVVNSTTLGTGDTAVRNRLQSLGYTVTVRDASAATTADATGKAVVVVSSTVAASSVGTKYRDVAVPVVAWENVLYDSDYMKLTGTTAGTDYGTAAAQTTLNIVTPSHPLAGGLTAGTKTVSASSSYTWGKPALSTGSQATVVARLTTGDTARAAIFGYEKGAAMVGLTAPARRVGFFLGDTTATSLTADGWKLFDAAIRWAAGTPAAAWGLSVTANNGGATLTWMPAAGATSYRILRSTSATGPFTTIATGVSLTTFTDSGLANGTTYFYQVVATNAGGTSSASASTSVKPAAAPLHAAVDGRPVLWKSPGTSDPEKWCEGDFYGNAVRVLSPTSVQGVSFTSRWEALAGEGSNPACVTIVNPTGNPCTIRATTTKGVVKIKYTATAGADTASVVFPLYVDDRIHPSVIFRFPEEDVQLDRTQRVPAGYTNADLWAGNADDSDVAARDRRGAARYKLASGFFTQVTDIWKQAAVQPYFLVESARGLKFNFGFSPSHEFHIDTTLQSGTRTLYPPSEFFEKVPAKNQQRYINVYFVSKLFSNKGPGTLAAVMRDFAMSNRSNTILLGDDAGPDTLAHEIGHVMQLRHIEATTVLASTLNNLTPVYPDAVTPRRYLLMWPYDDTINFLIPTDQAELGRGEMRAAGTKNILNLWTD